MKTVVAEVTFVDANGEIEYSGRCFNIESDDLEYIATCARYAFGPFFAIDLIYNDLNSDLIYGELA